MILGLSLLGIMIIILYLIYLLKRSKENRRGWKIRKTGNNYQEYAEFDSGKWRSLNFKFEMYSKEVPRHAIVIPKDWSNFPSWAQDKREVIILRLKEVLKEPTYTLLEKD
ncbi:MAG: hypothetical protein CL840_19835 [Crocinitomicaceae bacterium]|mgnify:CR=1 FL=1|nr:hypothetical protein [Crocinitomicaceae bacterium]|tara:strand:- start:1760 stop:2089 length:330 start_codon:yes stop_codon:yes gene_type:complete